MQRRHFLKSTAALLAAPLVPVPTVAASAAAPAAPIGGVSAALFDRAASLASERVFSSAAILGRRFALSPGEASELFQALVSKGVVGQPAANGLARATVPFYQKAGFIADKALARERMAKAAEAAKNKLLEVAETEARALVAEDDDAADEDTAGACPEDEASTGGLS